MIQLTCSNIICGKTFFHDEVKFPKAAKVQCPHCKTLQPIPPQAVPPAGNDWLPPKKDAPPAPAPVPPPPDLSGKKGEEEDFFTPRNAPPVPPPTPPKPQPSPLPTVVGWLVIHDEQTATETFVLQRGRNAIGRQTSSTPPKVNIAIETQDGFMSRYHCDLAVEENLDKTGYEYRLSDGALGKKPSTNGTFLNGKGRMKAMDIWPMKDGDTIQAGRTKLVLKLPGSASDAQDARDQVGPTDYFDTIIT